MYDSLSEKWTQLPSMLVGRNNRRCGSARKTDGTLEVVVLQKTVKIFNFESNSWRSVERSRYLGCMVDQAMKTSMSSVKSHTTRFFFIQSLLWSMKHRLNFPYLPRAHMMPKSSACSSSRHIFWPPPGQSQGPTDLAKICPYFYSPSNNLGFTAN